MEPITLATTTSALTLLATEVAKGLGDEAGKDLWEKVKRLLHWSGDPQTSELSVKLATELSADDELASQVIKLLQSSPNVGTPAALVGRIDADKVFVTHGDMNVHTMTFH